MLRSGHYGTAMALYAPVGFLLLSVDQGLAVLAGACAVALSRLPDVDNRIPFVDHRGITHTLLFLVVVAAVLGGIGHTAALALGRSPVLAAAVGVAVGSIAVGSHLLADAITPWGVPLLWPASGRRVSANLATASNPVANYSLLAVGVAATVIVVYVNQVVLPEGGF